MRSKKYRVSFCHLAILFMSMAFYSCFKKFTGTKEPTNAKSSFANLLGLKTAENGAKLNPLPIYEELYARSAASFSTPPKIPEFRGHSKMYSEFSLPEYIPYVEKTEAMLDADRIRYADFYELLISEKSKYVGDDFSSHLFMLEKKSELMGTPEEFRSRQSPFDKRLQDLKKRLTYNDLLFLRRDFAVVQSYHRETFGYYYGQNGVVSLSLKSPVSFALPTFEEFSQEDLIRLRGIPLSFLWQSERPYVSIDGILGDPIFDGSHDYFHYRWQHSIDYWGGDPFDEEKSPGIAMAMYPKAFFSKELASKYRNAIVENQSTLSGLISRLPEKLFTEASVSRFLFFIANELDPKLARDFAGEAGLQPNSWAGSPLKPREFAQTLSKSIQHAEVFLKTYANFECLQKISNTKFLEEMVVFEKQKAPLVKLEEVLSRARVSFLSQNTLCTNEPLSMSFNELEKRYPKYKDFISFLARN